MNNPFKKKKLVIEDFLHVIPWEDIEQRLGKREYKKFCKFMAGQTVSTHGVYPDDLDRFLKGLPVID